MFILSHVLDVSAQRAAEQSSREYASALGTVSALARKISSGPDARRSVCDAALEASGATFAVLMEPSKDGYVTSTAMAGIEAPTVRLHLGRESSAVLVAFMSKQSFFLSDARGHPAASQRLVEVMGLTSLLCEPVLRDGEAVGVLMVGWDTVQLQLQSSVAVAMRLLSAEAAVAIERADLLAQMRDLARTDDLTGLPNRRVFAEELDRELARAGRHDRPLCVALLDLDRFKEFNDGRGHQAGDRLLREAAATWRSALGRPTDVLARYGGEEFVVLLPETDLLAARTALDRVRLATPGNQTCSVGIAQWAPGETSAQLIGRADAALYEAKEAGRDRITLAAPVQQPVT